MKEVGLIVLLVWLVTLGSAWRAQAELLINEILFNPPGPDAPNQYIELRGTPNLLIPPGTYLVSVDGDTNANPGAIRNIFELEGRRIGGNGFLVLLQKTNSYAPNPKATVLVNTDTGTGWGSGSSSSIGHRGANGQTDLEHTPLTFFLIQTANSPTLSTDIDANNDGAPDGGAFASWTVLDAVGALNDPGDIGYGLINFRRNASGVASGTVVNVGFNPSYFGRTGNTTGWAAGDWTASDNLGGIAPNWSLGSSANTVPVPFAGLPLNHLGSPNFGALAIPGVIITETGNSTDVVEAGATDTYSLSLNTAPLGPVSIEITAGPQVEISTNGGISFGSARTVTLASTLARTITVRAIDDNVVDTSPHPVLISHRVGSTSDPVNYPLSTLIPEVKVNVIENDAVLLSELKVNPPGSSDDPYEFIEIKGTPGALLTNVYLLAIEGNSERDPGTASLVVNLTSQRLGSSGLLIMVANGHPYTIPASTTVVTDSKLNAPGGGLGNGTISFLLVSSPSPITEGSDLDAGDNGILEGLPDGSTIMDAVGWSDGGGNDIVYGGVMLTQDSGTPDAATRFPGNNTPKSAAAWFNGDLAVNGGESLAYDKGNVSQNFPAGTVLTPGTANNTAPTTSLIAPLSGVIGDPTNPAIEFSVSDSESGPGALMVTASSSSPAVVPSGNLILSAGGGGLYTLNINPVGVGYTTITIAVSDGTMVGQTTFRYAASEMGRPGGRFHTSVSDGSTAIAIDDEFMFVGDDENQTIRIYARNLSGAPLHSYDMTSFLGLVDLEDGSPREVDLEASTRVGNRIYWMGSHSHSELGATRTNRSRIFATDVGGDGPDSTLTYVGRYDYLKVDLISWDVNNQHGKGANYYGLAASDADGVEPKAPDGSGFNLEGLCMAPRSATTAYIGFRAPIIPATNRARALIVPVTNFNTLAISGASPGSARFGPPIELNLGCRGIRSIEGNDGGILIVAGPAGPATGATSEFKLFTWTGQPADAPQERAADLTGMNPEGIVELPIAPWTAASQVQLISDNGTTIFYGDGIEAKHLAIPSFKKFRSDWVSFGAVTVSQPLIRSITLSGHNLIVSWCTVPGRTYRVQYKAQLKDPAWIDLTGDVLATEAIAMKIIPIGTAPQRFYHVALLP